jgi:hypothetical protein
MRSGFAAKSGAAYPPTEWLAYNSFMAPVDTSTLEKTVANLATALAVLDKAETPEQHWTARNSVVLEFVLCWGRVRSSLERALIRLDALDHDRVRSMTFGELIREANDRGYSKIEWENWKRFRDARNAASHEYREESADAIVVEAKQFLSAISQVAEAIRAKT